MLSYHPFAEKFPMLQGEQWGEFKQSIANTKGNETPVTYRLVKGKKQGLDGRNRERACEELGLKCRYKLVNVWDEEVKNYILRQNVHRRHLTKEQRREFVSELHAAGMTTREIAETVGVNQSTVVRDLQNSTEAGDANASGNSKNTGKNANNPPGGDSAAPADSKEIRCERCTRLNINNPECQGCKVTRRETAKRNGEHVDREPGEEGDPEGESTEPDVVKDAEGHVVYGGPELAFRNLDRFREIDSLLQKVQGLIHEASKAPGGEQLARCLQPTGYEGKTINKSEHLNALKRDLKGTRPHSVCPWCKGKCKPDCKGCAGAGWVTAVTWKDAPKEIKARLP